MRLGQEI